MEVQVCVLWAIQNGHFDSVQVSHIKDCQAKMMEFLSARKDGLLSMIRDEKALTDQVKDELAQAIEDFKSGYKAS